MKLIEIKSAVDAQGQLTIPMRLLQDMGLKSGDEVRLTYAGNSNGMDNTFRQFVITADGIADAIINGMEADGDTDLALPHDLLEAARIPMNSDLEVVCATGAIVILPSDILDSLPDDLRELFEDLGICPDTVREVLRNGGVHHE